MTKYMTHSPPSVATVKYLGPFGPPNSPPMLLFRRINSTIIAITAPEQNRVTENAKLEGIQRIRVQ